MVREYKELADITRHRPSQIYIAKNDIVNEIAFGIASIAQQRLLHYIL